MLAPTSRSLLAMRCMAMPALVPAREQTQEGDTFFESVAVVQLTMLGFSFELALAWRCDLSGLRAATCVRCPCAATAQLRWNGE